jgi:diguanylate cyclase (GGDEF)-like protein
LGAKAVHDAAGKRPASTLLFMDDDNFKSVKDSWCLAAGDLVLIEVVQAFARKRYLAFRLGGDEFAMILHSISDLTEAQEALARLKQNIEQPIALNDGKRIVMTLSADVALTSNIDT